MCIVHTHCCILWSLNHQLLHILDTSVPFPGTRINIRILLSVSLVLSCETDTNNLSSVSSILSTMLKSDQYMYHIMLIVMHDMWSEMYNIVMYTIESNSKLLCKYYAV